MNQVAINTENRFDQNLRRLEKRFHFCPGQMRLEREGDALLQVKPDPSSTVAHRHLITLSKKLRPAYEVQQLACGVLRSGGELVAAAWTNRLGQVQFSLPEGDYCLRYVWTLQEPIDVEILVMIGDQLAYETLRDYLEHDELSAELSERVRTVLDSALQEDSNIESDDNVLKIAGALVEFDRLNEGQEEVMPLAVPGLRQLQPEKYGAWYREATATAETQSLAAHSADEGPTPDEDGDFLTVEGDQIVVQVPADQAPYGVVRIVAQQGEQLLGTCLLPLIRYGEKWRYNTCLVDEILRDRDPRTVDWYVQPALQAVTLAWFPAAKIRELLQRRDVQTHQELEQRIQLLLELAKEREAEIGE